MKTSIKVRPGNISDAQAIAGLMQGLGFDHSREEIERRWEMIECSSKDHTLIAEDARVPVGVICVHVAPLLFYPKPLARITTLVVDQRNRRCGIGRLLVEEAIFFASKAGCETIELTTGIEREDAQAFYLSVGFQHSALRMSCKL